MAMLFFDSFDHYVTVDQNDKWTTGGGGNLTIQAGLGRRGTQAHQNTTSDSELQVATQNTTEWFLAGIAHDFQEGENTAILLIRDTDAELLVFLYMRGDGGFDAFVGANTTQGTRHTLTRSGLWHQDHYGYLEFRGRLHDSLGELHCYFNGRLEGSVTGIDTIPSAQGAYTPTTPWKVFAMSPRGLTDDVYLANSGGEVDASAGNIGDIHVEALKAVTDATETGTHTDWTPVPTSDHGANVDEALIDDDTTYNQHGTITEKDSYHFESLSEITAGTIYGVQYVAGLRKDGGGTRDVRLLSRPGSTDDFGVVESISSDSYIFYRKMDEVNPDTSSKHTIAAVNGTQGGVEINN